MPPPGCILLHLIRRWNPEPYLPVCSSFSPEGRVERKRLSSPMMASGIGKGYSMIRRGIFVGVVLLCSMFSVSAAMAEDSALVPMPQWGLFMVTPEGAIQTFSLQSLGLDPEATPAPAERVCNGGSVYCTNGGPTLSCPSSGGPTCTGNQVCTCRCKPSGEPTGGLVAFNVCV